MAIKLMADKKQRSGVGGQKSGKDRDQRSYDGGREGTENRKENRGQRKEDGRQGSVVGDRGKDRGRGSLISKALALLNGYNRYLTQRKTNNK